MEGRGGPMPCASVAAVQCGVSVTMKELGTVTVLWTTCV